MNCGEQGAYARVEELLISFDHPGNVQISAA
jgi:hypothetical protein